MEPCSFSQNFFPSHSAETHYIFNPNSPRVLVPVNCPLGEFTTPKNARQAPPACVTDWSCLLLSKCICTNIYFYLIKVLGKRPGEMTFCRSVRSGKHRHCHDWPWWDPAAHWSRGWGREPAGDTSTWGIWGCWPLPQTPWLWHLPPMGWWLGCASAWEMQ